MIMVMRETRIIRQATEEQHRLGGALSRLQDVLILLGDVESGERGYLLTEKDADLASCRDAVTRIPGFLTVLQPSSQKNQSDSTLINDVTAQTARKLAQLTLTIRLLDLGNHAAALALVRTGQDQSITEHLRADIQALRANYIASERTVEERIAQSMSYREQLAISAAAALLISLGIAAFQAVRQFAAQRRLELTLTHSERMHRALVEEQSEVIAVARSDGSLEYINPAFSRMFDLRAEDSHGRSLLEWIEPSDRRLMEKALQEALTATDPVAVECRVQRRGPELWLSWRLQAQAHTDRLVHAVGRDVTPRKRVEAALRASEEFLIHTNQVAGVGGWKWDLGTGEIYWSKEVRRIHGVSDDYVPSLESALAFYAPEAREKLERAIQEARLRGTPWDLELEFVPTSGNSTCVRAVGEAECNERGVPVGMIGTFQDITMRKRLELQLEANERFIRGITDSVPARIAYLGTDHRFQFVNHIIVERFGMSRELLIGSNLLDILPPVSRSGWETMLAAAAKGQRQRHEYDDTIDGQVRRIEVQLTPDKSASGEVRGFVLIGNDITHLKRVERELRELTEVFDNTTDYVAQADWKGNVLYINRSARRALGFAEDRALEGHTSYQFYTPETNERFIREIVPAVKENLVWVGETQVVLKGGDVVPVNHMVIGHRDAQGRVSRYSSLMRDITVEVGSREKLARQAATLNTVIEAIPAMVSVYDRDSRVILVNQAYESWRGRPRAALIGRSLKETMDVGEYEQSRPWMERVLGGETVSYEKEYPRAATIRHVSVTYVPLKMPDGSTGGYLSVAQDITRQREESIRLVLLSERDPLTGILNRAGFEQFIESQVNQRAGAKLAVIYIDLDHFKPVNDTYGHAAGDRVLQEFALRLLNSVRPTDAVARLGGDEFAIILLGVRDLAGAAKVAEKVVSAANQPFFIDRDTQVSISASVGVAHDADWAGGWKALIDQADAMAYQAKSAGRGCFVLAPQHHADADGQRVKVG